MALLMAVLLAQEPQFTGWDLARERVGHRVVADAILLNGGPSPLAEGKLVVVFYDRTLELKRSKLILVPRLEPGASTKLKIEVEQLPKFSRYEAFLQDGPHVWLFLGEDPARAPALRKREPARLELVSATPRDGGQTLVVRNIGEVDAGEPTAVAGATRIRLGGAVRGATEDAYHVPTADAVTKVVWLAAEGPSQTAKDVPQMAVTRFRTLRLTDGSARIEGVVRNGLPKPVEKATVTFKLGGKAVPVRLAGLAPGESRPFEAYAADVASLDAVSYDLEYSEGAATAPPSAPAAAVKRLSSRPIEIPRPKLPEPAPEAAPAPAAEAGMKVELRGLMVVEGYRTPKSNTYTGDVYLLRVLFTDGEGKPAKPNATFQVALLDGKNPPWKIQRIVGKPQWAVDAARVNNMSVEHTTMACDAKTGELWIGLIRTPGGTFEFQAQITLVVRGEGTWEWKGVGEKFEVPPRGPDKPDKK